MCHGGGEGGAEGWHGQADVVLRPDLATSTHIQQTSKPALPHGLPHWAPNPQQRWARSRTRRAGPPPGRAHLLPGLLSQHGREQGVGVPGVHLLAVALDPRLVCARQARQGRWSAQGRRGQA
jgi:hypothetical protein